MPRLYQTEPAGVTYNWSHVVIAGPAVDRGPGSAAAPRGDMGRPARGIRVAGRDRRGSPNSRPAFEEEVEGPPADGGWPAAIESPRSGGRSPPPPGPSPSRPGPGPAIADGVAPPASMPGPGPAHPPGQHLEEPGPQVDRQAGQRTGQQGDHSQRPEHRQSAHQVVVHRPGLPSRSSVRLPHLSASALVTRHRGGGRTGSEPAGPHRGGHGRRGPAGPGARYVKVEAPHGPRADAPTGRPGHRDRASARDDRDPSRTRYLAPRDTILGFEPSPIGPSSCPRRPPSLRGGTPRSFAGGVAVRTDRRGSRGEDQPRPRRIAMQTRPRNGDGPECHVDRHKSNFENKLRRKPGQFSKWLYI